MHSLYEPVVALVAEQTGVRAETLRPETTLFGDLGVDGLDGVELLEAFGRAFAVDMSGCDPNRYFGPEGAWSPIVSLVLAFRKGSPEQRARLEAISINDLVRSAKLRRWAGR